MKFTAKSFCFRKACKIMQLSEREQCAVKIIADITGPPGQEHGYVNIKAVDGFKSVSLTFDADVLMPGEATFSSKYLPLICCMDSEDLAVHKKTAIEIKGVTTASSDNVVRIACIDDASYQDIQRADTQGTITIDLGKLKDLFKRVLFASGMDDQERGLGFGCIQLECERDRIKAVGSDRRVVAICELQKPSPFVGTFLLPKEGIRTIIRLEGDLVSLDFYPNAVGVVVEGDIMVNLYIQQYSILFPDYQASTELKYNTRVDGDREELLYVLSKMMVLGNEVIVKATRGTNYVKHPVRFSVKDINGTCLEMFPNVKWDGDEVRVRVNGKTLYSAIESARGEVTVSFTSEIGPLSVKDAGGDYQSVMMPYSPSERR